MYSKLFRSFIFPLMELSQGTKIQKYLKWLEKTQWWKQPSEIKELQNKKLRALIRHAYENVPYYHKLFRKLNLKPDDIEREEDLRKLPILRKEDIRKNFSELLARDFKRWKPKLNATSGSTGEPLKYYITMDSISIGWASGFRAWGSGYKLGDKYAMLGGSSLVPKNITLKKRIRYLFERALPLTSLYMTEEKMREYARKLEEFKPKFIRGYPSALFILAKYLHENDYNDIRPRAVFTTAETLLPYQRKVIEDVFGCDVYDGYGCRDGNANAMECVEHTGYHIAAEQVIMEFVSMKDGEHVSPGEMGEIIATDLHNYAMPFIRYAVEDVAVPSDEICPCGRGLPLLKSIEGRVFDIIKLKDGTMLSGVPLTDELDSMESVKQYQIIQESEDEIIVKIVKEKGYAEEDTKRILRMLREGVGEEMNIKIEFVNEISTTKAGKRRYIISKV